MQRDQSWYRWYVLGVLTLVYVFNFVDRQILVVLQEPIKAEMGLSDTQLGLLTGFMFALFYVGLGIPIARLADRGNRRNVVACSIAIWSLMTALSAAANNYTQLLLARIGVGVGEAGGSPPAHSMISDYFPPRLRAVALAIFSSGIYIGIMVGFLVGGYISAHYGWRMAFLVVGIPGIFIALLVRFTVREPTRGKFDNPATGAETDAEIPSTWQAFKLFWKLKTFRYLALGCALTSFSSYGVNNWLPSFMIRAHDMSLSEVGVAFAFLVGVCGFFGALVGGFACSSLIKRDIRWYLWLPCILSVSSLPLAVACFLQADFTYSLLLYIWPVIAGAVYLGPGTAVCHSLVDSRLRALISAVLLFIVNLIGLGLGPVFTGIVSDQLTASYGAVDALRYALIATTVVGALSPVFFLIAARSIKEETAGFNEA